MKKFLFAALLFTTSLFAEIEWQSSYEAALEKAKEVNKPILVLLVSEHCRWCHKLQERTLKNPDVENFINRRFIPLLVNRDKGGYPAFIKSKYVPTTFYISPDEKMLIKPVAGYWEPYDYMSDLKLAVRVFKKSRALR
ncbi:thioredoxin family protein [Hydrogenimonas sp.]